MEWRIRESSHGGFVAERGMKHEGGVLAPSDIGCTMPVRKQRKCWDGIHNMQIWKQL